MLSPAPLSPTAPRRRPTVTLVLLLACALGFGWVSSKQATARPAVDRAVERVEKAIVAAPMARLSPSDVVGLPDRWREELGDVTEESGPRDPELSAAVAELRDRVHELPTWRFGWIPTMKSPAGWLTYLLVHEQWFHLLVNLTLLGLLGATLEIRRSPRLVALIFVFSGAAGAWTHAALFSDSTVPLLGASASVAGVLGGLLASRPGWTLPFVVQTPRGRARPPARLEIPLLAILCIWVGLEGVALTERQSAPIALPAHLGGFVTGVVLAWFSRRTRGQSPEGPAPT